MNRQFVAEQVPAFGGLDGIDVADNVCDGDVRSLQLFDKARIAINPGNGCGILVQLDRLPSVSADRMKRIVVDIRTGNDGNLLVEKICELANDAALRLAAQSQQNQIVAGENGINKLRHDGFVITNNAGEKFLAPLEFADEVCPHLVFD